MFPHNPPTAGAPAPRRTGLWLALVLVLAVGVFAPTLLNGYTYDDPHYARVTTPAGETNPMVAELRPFTEYWRKPMNWGLPRVTRGFRPITVYSYALVNHWCDPGDSDDAAAWAHHLFNLLLHGLGTLAVFGLVCGLLGRGPGLIAALVFGVHALHSGSVAAIVGRAELFAFAFGAAATLGFERALRTTGWQRNAMLGGTSIALLLALGSKESAAAWAAFIPFYCRARGRGWRAQAWPALVALAVPLAVFLALRHQMMIEHVTPRGPFFVEYDANPLFYRPWIERVTTATSILVYGLAKTCLPLNLSSNYGDGPFTMLRSLLDWRFQLASLAIVVILVAAWRARRGHPTAALAAVAFFGFAFITSNIPFPIETIFGERLFYAPSLGFALFAGWVAHRMPRRHWRIGATVLLVWVAWNATLSVERSRAWFSNATLIATDLKSQPDSVGLHLDMSHVRSSLFDADGARRECELAVAINPFSARALRFLAEHVRDDEAAEELLLRARATPYLVRATEGRPVYWQLSQLYKRTGRPAEARAAAEMALQCNPYMPDIRIHLMREAIRAGETARFVDLLDEGRALDPENRVFEVFRGVLAHAERRYEDAARIFRAALPGQRDHLHIVEAWLRYADCLQRAGELRETRGIAERFVRDGAKFPGVAHECRRLLRATTSVQPPR